MKDLFHLFYSAYQVSSICTYRWRLVLAHLVRIFSLMEMIFNSRLRHTCLICVNLTFTFVPRYEMLLMWKQRLFRRVSPSSNDLFVALLTILTIVIANVISIRFLSSALVWILFPIDFLFLIRARHSLMSQRCHSTMMFNHSKMFNAAISRDQSKLSHERIRKRWVLVAYAYLAFNDGRRCCL